MRVRSTLLLAAVAAAAAQSRGAQSPAPSASVPPGTIPAGTMPTGTMPTDGMALEAVITSVKGVVQVRTAEDQPWQPAKVGMRLNQGADIRTGLRSVVQFRVEPDQTITLDRLGTVRVLQAFRTQGKVTTDLGMKYGRAQYDIQKTDLEHAATIRSPGSTLALRGTNVVYEDQAPWVPTAVSREGRAEIRNFRREVVAFGGGAGRAIVAADKAGPAQTAVARTRVDPRTPFSGRTDSEQELLVELTSTGGVDAQALQAVQELARLGGFTGDFIGAAPVPGPLDFRLDWISTAASPNAADVDLLVTDPRGQTATALNPTIGTGSAQGVHSGNDAGGSGAGAEGVVWGLFFPSGRYTVTATHRGGDAAQIFLTITKGESAEPFQSFGVEPAPAIVLQPGESFTGTVNVDAGTSGPTPQTTARSIAARRADDARAARALGITRGTAGAAVREPTAARPFVGPRDIRAGIERR